MGRNEAARYGIVYRAEKHRSSTLVAGKSMVPRVRLATSILHSPRIVVPNVGEVTQETTLSDRQEIGLRRDLLRSALTHLTERERDILTERGAVEVRCEFCNRSYRFDAVDVAGLFASEPPAPHPPGRH